MITAVAILAEFDHTTRAAFIAALSRVTSPAQRFYIAWHLTQGRPAVAMLIAQMTGEYFAAHDAAMGLAFAMGAMR